MYAHARAIREEKTEGNANVVLVLQQMTKSPVPLEESRPAYFNLTEKVPQKKKLQRGGEEELYGTVHKVEDFPPTCVGI